MKDRFDLENEIMQLNGFSDMLKTLSENVLEDSLTAEETANALLGVSVLIECYSNKMMDTMSQAFGLDEYNSCNPNCCRDRNLD